MISVLRKNQQVLMAFVTVLVIIAFVWLYNGVQWEKMGADRIATIYGRSVTLPEYERTARMLYLANDLGLASFVRTLAGIGPSETGEDNFVWNLMVLANQSGEMQIHPTVDGVASRIRTLPVFQTEGRFDLQKYGIFVEQALGPRGFTEQQLQEVVRDEMRLSELKELIASTISTSPEELRDLYEREYGKVNAAVVSFDRADLQKESTPTGEEVRNAFEARKDNLKSDELRRVSAATFALSEEDSKKEGREKIQALQDVANRAQELGQKLLEPDASFPALAKQQKVAVSETGPFSQGNPPEALDSSPALAAAAFQLTPEHPNSDVLQAGDKFFVLHLEETVPSEPLTFEQAKPRLEAELQSQRAAEKLSLRVAAARQTLQKALEAGKTFDEAAAQAALKATDFPEFSMAEPTFEGADAPAVMQTAIGMKKGELSQPVPTQSGMLLIYVKDRPPVDQLKFESEKGRLTELMRQSKSEVAFAEWLRLRRKAADVQQYGLLR